MKPIRGERSEDVVHDPWDFRARKLGQDDTLHVVTDEGGIDSHRTGHRVACVCGCLKPPGGFCAECVQPVCADCYGFCAGSCRKPLCPRHSVFVLNATGEVVRFCRACHGQVSRKKIVRGVFRTLLSPFVRFEDPRGQG